MTIFAPTAETAARIDAERRNAWTGARDAAATAYALAVAVASVVPVLDAAGNGIGVAVNTGRGHRAIDSTGRVLGVARDHGMAALILRQAAA